MSASNIVILVVAAVFLALYLMRRRSRLKKDM